MKLNFKLLSWFSQNKKDLPWRKTQDPYKIWLSEIILQQTRINQGLEYYERFIKTFPTVENLAKAKEEEVLKLWQGLGYYSRARNIHFTAKFIFFEQNGAFPNSFKDLQQLKGIGKYTAAAIASIVHQEPVAAIDGNAFRVYARLFSIDLDIAKSSSFNYFFALGNSIIDKQNPGDFNQAIMDLGSTICLPKNPLCEKCPIQTDCKSFSENTVQFFPVKSKKQTAKEVDIHYLLILDKKNTFILRKRDDSSIWANLFDLPEIKTIVRNKNDIELLIKNNEIDFLFSKEHLLTHRKLKIYFYSTVISDDLFYQELLKNEKYVRVRKSELHQYALPKPIEFLFNQNVLL